MRIVILAALEYEVAVVCDVGYESQVGRTLLEAESKYPKAYEEMRAVLFEECPRFGPPIGNTERVRDFGPGLREFCSCQPPKVVGYRIPFFMDGKRVVCTSAFFKFRSTPKGKQAEADAVFRQYLKDRHSALEVIR